MASARPGPVGHGGGRQAGWAPRSSWCGCAPDVSTALVEPGGVGVFVAAVREAVLDGGCDCRALDEGPATTPAPGLVVAAIPELEDPRDALCARDGLTLTDLPSGAKVGTGSPRRAAQLRAARPDLHIVDIRGNVDTRLGWVGDDLDAAVLAAAGLNRLGRPTRSPSSSSRTRSCPHPPRSAGVGVPHRRHRAARLLARLDYWPTLIAVSAERDLMRLIEAGCAAPFGALATVGDGLRLRARLAHPTPRSRWPGTPRPRRRRGWRRPGGGIAVAAPPASGHAARHWRTWSPSAAPR